MNKIFKVVWNHQLQRKVVASELAQSHISTSSTSASSSEIALTPAHQSSYSRGSKLSSLFLATLLGLGGSYIASAQELTLESIDHATKHVIDDLSFRNHSTQATQFTKADMPFGNLLTTQPIDYKEGTYQQDSLLLSGASSRATIPYYYTYEQKKLTTGSSTTTKPATVQLANSYLGNTTLANPSELIKLPEAGKTGSTYWYTTFLFRPTFNSETTNVADYSFFIYSSPADSILILYKGKYDPERPNAGAIAGNDDAGNLYKDQFQDISGVMCGTTNYCPGMTTPVENGEVYTVWVSAYSPSSSSTVAKGTNKLVVGGKSPRVNGEIGQFSNGVFKPIDTKKTYYDSYDIDFNVKPEFQGGTLRLFKPSFLGAAATGPLNIDQKFLLSSKATNTVETDGHIATFKGPWVNLGSESGVITFKNSQSNNAKITFTDTSTFTGGTTIEERVDLFLKGNKAQLGTGYINIKEGASLNIVDATNYQLVNQLKGNGDIQVNMSGATSQLMLGSKVGSGFTGQFRMEKGTLTGDNLSIMNNSEMSLRLLKDGALTVTKPQAVTGNLIADGGTINVMASKPLTVGSFNLTDEGATVNMTLDKDGFKRPQDNFISQSQSNNKNYVLKSDTEIDLTHQGMLRTTLQNAPGITANDGLITVVVDNGFGNSNLEGIYELKGNGLTLDAQGISYVVQLQALKSVTQALLSAKSLEGEQAMNAKLTGEGGYTFEGNAAGLLLTQKNDYRGETIIRSGKVVAGNNDSLGQSSKLTLNESATFDLADKTQTIGSLSGLAGSTLILGGGILTLQNEGGIAGNVQGQGNIKLSENSSLQFTGSGTISGKEITVENLSTKDVLFNNSADTLFAGKITGNQGIIQDGGDHTLTLVGSILTEGSHQIKSGNLRIGDGTQKGIIQGDIGINNIKSTLIFDQGGETVTEYANNITGAGQLENRSGHLTLTGENSYVGGTLITGGQVTIHKNGALGQGSVDVAENGVLYLQQVEGDLFNHSLTGTGLLKIEGVGQTTGFTLAESVGSEFKGGVEFNNLKFAVSRRNNGVINSDNNLTLNDALLVVDQDFSTKNLIVNSGGTIRLFGTLEKSPKAEGVLTVNHLDVQKGGKIELVVDGKITDEPGYGPIEDGYELDAEELFIRGTKKQHTLTLIKSNEALNLEQVVLNGQATKVTQSPDDLVDVRSTMKQNGEVVATVKYGEGVTDNYGSEHGLFLISGLYGIKIHDGKKLSVTAVKEYEDKPFSVLLTGSGNLHLDAADGVMRFGNEANDYQGTTEITNGQVILVSDNAFGSVVEENDTEEAIWPVLNIADNAILDLNNFQQSLGTLTNKGKVTFTGDESQLTITTETDKISQLGVMSGSVGQLILAGGHYEMNVDNGQTEHQFDNAMSIADSAIVDVITAQTIQNKLSGAGQFNLKENLTLTGDNSDYAGLFDVSDQKSLSITAMNQLGSAKIALQGENAQLNLGHTTEEGESASLSNILSGNGQINVKGNTLVATTTEDGNDKFSGHWNVVGSVLTVNDSKDFGQSQRVTLGGENARFDMNYQMEELSADIRGTGTLRLGVNSEIGVKATGADHKSIDETINIDLATISSKLTYNTNHFNHQLTGEGDLIIDATQNGQQGALTFNKRVGDQFAGNLFVQNAKLAFNEEVENQWNKQAVTHSSLFLQKNSDVTVGQNITTKDLALDAESQLHLSGDLAGRTVVGKITTGELALTNGTILLDVAGLGSNEPNSVSESSIIQADEMNLFDLGTGVQNHLTFIESQSLITGATKVVLNGQVIALNADVALTSQSQLQQNKEHVANLTFSNRVTTTKDNSDNEQSGLFLSTGLSQIDLLDGKYLEVIKPENAATNNPFSTLVTGAGNLILAGDFAFGHASSNEGNSENAGNSYTGNTTVSAGKIIANADNAFGLGGDLILAENATVDLNGKVQTIDTLDNKGTLSFNGGILTIQKDSILTGLKDDGKGKLIIAGGTSTVNKANEGFSAIVEVQEEAQLTLNSEQTVNNQLTGDGKINITNAISLSNSENKFAGLFNVEKGDNAKAGSLTTTDVKQLGTATIALQAETALNLNHTEDSTLVNILGGQGAVNVNGNTALSKDSSNFTGQFNVADKTVLTATDLNQLGKAGEATISLADQNATLKLDLAAAQAGEDGSSQVEEWSNKITGNGRIDHSSGQLQLGDGNESLSSFNGQWQIGEESQLTAENGAKLGDTAFDVTGLLTLKNDKADTTDQPYIFNQALTGNGKVSVIGREIDEDGHSTKFILGEKVGNGFTGELDFTQTTFNLNNAASEQLKEATITADHRSTIQIGNDEATETEAQNVGQFNFGDSILVFRVKQNDQSEKTDERVGKNEIYTTGTLNVAGDFNILPLMDGENYDETKEFQRIDLIADKGLTIPDLPDENNAKGLSIFQLDEGAKVEDIITAKQITGNVSDIHLTINDEIKIEDRVIDLRNEGESKIAAKGTFNFRLVKNVLKDSESISVNYGMTQLELIGKGKDAFIIGLPETAKNESADFSAVITGAGDMILNNGEGDTGNQRTASFSNRRNDYEGQTIVDNFSLRLDNDGVLGNTSLLNISDKGIVNINSKTQMIGALNNEGKLLLGEGETLGDEKRFAKLTIENRPLAEGGELQSSKLGVVSGIGTIILSQGQLAVNDGGKEESGVILDLQENSITNVNISDNGQLNHILAGKGEVNILGNTTLLADNKDFTGIFEIIGGKELTANELKALGQGQVNLAKEESTLNLGAGTLSNVLSGQGKVNVQENLTLAEETDNGGFTGEFNVTNEKSLTVTDEKSFGRTSAVNLIDEKSQFNMNYEMENLKANITGSGQLNIGENASMTVLATEDAKKIDSDVKIDLAKGAIFTNKADTFNHSLTGSGLLTIDAGDKENKFTFGENVGNAFAGTVNMTNSKFELVSGKTELNNATLQIGDGNSTEVKDQGNKLAGLEMIGGELHLSKPFAPDQDKASIDLENTLDLSQTGTIYLQVNGLGDPLTRGEMAKVDDATIDLFALGSGVNNEITFITAEETEVGDASEVEIKLNGEAITLNSGEGSNSTTHLQQKDQNGIDQWVADLVYSNQVNTKSTSEQAGLFVVSALTKVDILKGKTLSLINKHPEDDETQNFTVLVSGEGNLSLSGDMGFGNSQNNYSGNTTIEKNSNVTLVADNAFGTEGDLIVVAMAKVDLNGKNQVISKLNNAGSVDIHEGKLTINSGSNKLTGLIGKGELVIAQGTSTVGEDADNEGLEANIAINEGAGLNLNKEAGIGTGDFTIAGTLNLDAADQTVKNKLSGDGAINVNADATITNENNDFAGTFEVIDGKELTANELTALGKGQVNLAEKGSLLNLGAGTLANVLLGQGKVNVQENLALAVKEGANNEAFTGQFNVADEKSLTVNDADSFGKTSAVNLTGKQSQFNMNYEMGNLSADITGSGLLQVGDSGKLTVLADGNKIEDSVQMAIAGEVNYQKSEFNHALTGIGLLNINAGKDQSLAFGKNVGDQFTGTVQLTNTKFNFSNENKLSNQATLILGVKSETNISDTGNKVANLVLNSGTLNLSKPFATGQEDASLTVESLDLSGKGTLNLSVDGLGGAVGGNSNTADNPYSNQTVSDIDLFDLGSDLKNEVTFINVTGKDGVIGHADGGYGVDVTLNGQAIKLNEGDHSSQVQFMQNGEHIADLIYQNNAVTTSFKDQAGIFIVSGLTDLKLLEGKILTLENDQDESRDFTTAVQGKGSIILSGNMSFGNNENRYSGDTTVLSESHIKATTNNAFGSGGDLIVAENATVDLNGKAQSVGTLANQGKVTIGKEGQLTIDTLNNTDNGKVELADGTLTINNDSELTGLVGDGALVIAGGISTVGTEANNQGLTANIAINEDATLNLNKGNGIGEGNFNIAGTLNLGAKDQTVSNKLSGGGVINVKESATVTNENNDFAGIFEVIDGKALTANELKALGKGQVNLAEKGSLNLGEGTLTNVLSGEGQVNVQKNLTLAEGTDNSGFTGQFNITDGKALTVNNDASFGKTSEVNLTGKQSQFNMNYEMDNLSANINGNGQLHIGDTGKITVLANGNTIENSVQMAIAEKGQVEYQKNEFNHKLTGDGTLTVNLEGNEDKAFIFGNNEEVGDQFKGTVNMTHSQFELNSNNKQLNNATLQLGAGSAVTVKGDKTNTLSKLQTEGGQLSFTGSLNTGSLNQGTATHITADEWKVAGKSEIHLTVDGLEPAVAPYSDKVKLTDSSIFEQFNIGKNSGGKTLTFITLKDNATTQGDVSQLNIYVNGQSSDKLARQSTSKVIQEVNEQSIHNADIYFGYNINANQGLTLTTDAVTEVELLGKGNNAFTMIAKNNEHFDALLSGEGDLILGSTENAVLSLDKANSYSGNTTVTSGTVQANADNIFGTEGTLKVAENATVDLNSKKQIIDQLDNAGTVNLRGGQLTINEGSNLTGLTGSGALILVSGLSTVMGVNSGLTAETEIQKDATVDLAIESGLGTGSVTVNGQLDITKDQRLHNDLKGSGIVNVKEKRAVEFFGDNSSFTGDLSIEKGADLTVTKVNQLGKGEGQKVVSLEGVLNFNGVTGAENKVEEIAQSWKGSGVMNFTESNVALLKESSNFKGSINLDKSALRVDVDQALGQASQLDIQAGSRFDLNGTQQSINSVNIYGGGKELKEGHFQGTGTLTTNNVINKGRLQVGNSEIELGEGLQLGAVKPTTPSAKRATAVADHLMITGNVENHNLIQIAGDRVGNVLTIQGNYTGAGESATILMNVDRTASGYESDQLIIKGQADGQTTVFVRDVNQRLKNMRKDQLQLIRTEGSTEDAFTLGNAVLGGGYQYKLTLEDNDWYLMREGYRADIGSNMANTLTAAQFQTPGFGGPIGGGITGGTGGLRSLARLQAGGGLVGEGNWGSGSIWNMTSGGKFKDRKATDEIHYDSEYYSTTFGGDYIFPMGDYTMQMGAMFSLLKGKNNAHTISPLPLSEGGFDENFSKGRLNGHIYSFYGTWYLDPKQGGLSPYIDGIVSYGHYRNKIETEGNPEDRYRSHLWSFTVQGGYPIDLGNNIVLEPQAQLSYLDFDARPYTDVSGTTISQELKGKTIARAGLFIYPKEGDIKPYGGINLWYDGTKAVVTADEDRVDGKRNGFMIEAKAGVGAVLSEDLTISVDAYYRQGRHKAKDYGLNASLKYRIPQKAID